MARFSLADFYFSLDADVLLTDPNTLTSLVNKNLMVVAPMLSSIGLYSNFWAGMSETFYYQRTDEYKKILNRKKVGCYQVPMIHTAVLIDLREEKSDLLTFLPDNIEEYPGPRDDIIVLALSATLRSLPLHVCNDRHYGTLTIPLEEGQDRQDDKEILRSEEIISQHSNVDLSQVQFDGSNNQKPPSHTRRRLQLQSDPDTRKDQAGLR